MQPIPICACFGEFLPLLSSSAGEINVSISGDWLGQSKHFEALIANESGDIFLNIGRQDGFVPFQINSAIVIIH